MDREAFWTYLIAAQQFSSGVVPIGATPASEQACAAGHRAYESARRKGFDLARREAHTAMFETAIKETLVSNTPFGEHDRAVVWTSEATLGQLRDQPEMLGIICGRPTIVNDDSHRVPLYTAQGHVEIEKAWQRAVECRQRAESAEAALAQERARADAEREACALLAEAFEDENYRMAMDTVHLSPVLRDKDFSPAAMKREADLTSEAHWHSAMSKAGRDIAAAIRARTALP